MSKKVSPLGLTTGIALFGWFVSLVCMLMLEGINGLIRFPTLSLSAWGALVSYSVASGGALMYFLIQWGIKRATPLAAASMIYITTFVSAFTGVAFLGEALTTNVFLSATFILIGVYLISILPVLSARRTSTNEIMGKEVGVTQ